MKKVAAFVYNNCKNDARVLKEAKTLVEVGFEVTIYALLDKETEPIEWRHGIRIIRVEKRALHLRLLRFVNRIVKPRFWISRFFRIFYGLARSAYSIITVFRSKDKNENEIQAKEYRILKRIKRVFSVSNIKKIRDQLLDNKARLILYGWILIGFFYLFIFGKNTIALVVKSMYGLVRQVLMFFHRPLSFLDYYYRVHKLIKSEGFGFYHAHDFNTVPIAFYAKNRYGGNFIYDSHELYVERNKLHKPSKIYKILQRKIEGYYIRNCDRVITVGPKIAEYIAELYKVEVPEVIMNAPSIDKFSSANESDNIRDLVGIDKDKKVLLYTGAITFNRGLENLILSMQYLPDYFLVILGYGRDKYKRQLENIVEANNLTDRFTFYGPVPTDQVAAFVSGSDLGVAPIQNACLSYYFCAPNKVFEYVIGGIPVIGSNFPELENIIVKHGIGFTFDPENPEDIASSVSKVFANKESYDIMKQKTGEVAKLYNWENESKKLIRIYQTLNDI